MCDGDSLSHPGLGWGGPPSHWWSQLNNRTKCLQYYVLCNAGAQAGYRAMLDPECREWCLVCVGAVCGWTASDSGASSWSGVCTKDDLHFRLVTRGCDVMMIWWCYVWPGRGKPDMWPPPLQQPRPRGEVRYGSWRRPAAGRGQQAGPRNWFWWRGFTAAGAGRGAAGMCEVLSGSQPSPPRPVPASTLYTSLAPPPWPHLTSPAPAATTAGKAKKVGPQRPEWEQRPVTERPRAGQQQRSVLRVQCTQSSLSPAEQLPVSHPRHHSSSTGSSDKGRLTQLDTVVTVSTLSLDTRHGLTQAQAQLSDPQPQEGAEELQLRAERRQASPPRRHNQYRDTFLCSAAGPRRVRSSKQWQDWCLSDLLIIGDKRVISKDSGTVPDPANVSLIISVRSGPIETSKPSSQAK